MKSNRHVPIIIGIVFIGLAGYLAIVTGGLWGVLGATICTIIGWPSLKTGLFASNNEILELTGVKDISEDTKEKFANRL